MIDAGPTSLLHTIGGVVSDDIITKGNLATPTKAAPAARPALASRRACSSRT